MKKNILLIIIFFIAIVLCACRKEVVNMPDSITQEIEGFQINNDMIGSSEISYPIAELKKVFKDDLMSTQAKDILYLSDIDEIFEIKYLRKIENLDSYYIAYPVSEGGKFLIFLCGAIDLETGEIRLCYSDSIYIHELPSEEIFDLVDGGNSYNDIQSLAPCTLLVTTESSSIVSYTPLRNGNVMLCTYKCEGNHSLMVNTLTILSREDQRFPFKGAVLTDFVE